jgi:hypothetical protein
MAAGVFFLPRILGLGPTPHVDHVQSAASVHRIHGDVDAPTAGFLGWHSDARARRHDTYIEATRKLSRVKQ